MMKEASIINERILQLIDYKTNNNQKKFAELIGFKPQVISNIVSGRKTKPSFDVLNAIKSTFDDIDSEWLLTGKGSMLREEKGTEVADHIVDSNKMVPLIPIDAMAGFGNGDISVMEYETEQYYVPEFERLNVDFMIRVKGSSMIPKYNSGDVVACIKISKTDLFFQWNKVYVLDTVQGALIKRVHRGNDPEHIKIVSENKDYEPFELSVNEDVRSVALVVGVIRLE